MRLWGYSARLPKQSVKYALGIGLCMGVTLGGVQDALGWLIGKDIKYLRPYVTPPAVGAVAGTPLEVVES
jgi:hypothetical protein